MTFSSNIQKTRIEFACISFRVGLLGFVNFSSFKPDTENNSNFDFWPCIKQTRQFFPSRWWCELYQSSVAGLFGAVLCSTWRESGRRGVLLKQQMLPVVRRIAGDVCVGVPAHRARETVQLLQQQTPEFISPDLWPPNSPDLNQVDYRICGLMQECVYKTRVEDVSQMKQRLMDSWSSLCQDVIDDTNDQWQVRLWACVKAKRRHFEHLLQ